MPMDTEADKMAIWGERALSITQAALDLLESGCDAIGQLELAVQCLKVQAHERPAGDLEEYFRLDEEETACTCPADLITRGGFSSSCQACNPRGAVPHVTPLASPLWKSR